VKCNLIKYGKQKKKYYGHYFSRFFTGSMGMEEEDEEEDEEDEEEMEKETNSSSSDSSESSRNSLTGKAEDIELLDPLRGDKEEKKKV